MIKDNTFKKEYVCLALFVDYLEKNDIDYHIESDKSDSTLNQKITVNFSVYTMNPVGYHIGYEEYSATFIVELKPVIQLNSKQVEINQLAMYCISLDDEIDFKFIDGPETAQCECTDDDCYCELYTSPIDDDVLFDDMYRVLVTETIEGFKENGPFWTYNGEQWEITNG